MSLLKSLSQPVEWLIAAFVVLALHACSTSYHRAPVKHPQKHRQHTAIKTVGNAPRTYRVQRNDTLYRIAENHGYTYRQVAAWNGLSSPYTIYPGQVLHLPGHAGAGLAFSASKPTLRSQTFTKKARKQAADIPSSCHPGGSWFWPARGTAQTVNGSNGKRALMIFGSAGQPVYAAAAGEVVYSGPEPGLNAYFGNLLIVEHNAAYRSVYAHNRALGVRQGEQVAAGQQIAEMGRNTEGRPALRFELRCHDRTVDPLRYLKFQ